MSIIKEYNYILPYGNREFIRRELIQLFLNEEPGTGNGYYASRYRYNVEYFGNYCIYLRRPTRLNKGFDFTINVEGLYFKKQRRYSSLSHEDVFNALLECKNNFPQIYPFIVNTINNIYYCVQQNIIESGASFHDYEGNKHPIEIILLALKWLFIEQDCTYWNFSGRAKLFNELIERELI